MALMFEMRVPQQVTACAASLPQLQQGYGSYGSRLAKHFDPARPSAEALA